MPITHSKISLLSNNGDPNLVQPSDWNAAHSISGTLDLSNTTGILGGIIPNSAIAFSATPVFNVIQNASYSMLLTGNVTSSSTFGNPINGQLLSLTLTEDGVGGRTFIFPPNFVFTPAFTLTTTANTINELTFKFDGANWHLISTGGSGGGGGNPAGNAGDLQLRAGAAFGASHINDSGILITTTLPTAFGSPFYNNATQAITGTTPTVSNGNVFLLSNGSATTVTNFVGGVDTQQITVTCADANTTFGTTGNITPLSGIAQPCSTNQPVSFVFNNSLSKWLQTGSAAGPTGAPGDLQAKLDGAHFQPVGINQTTAGSQTQAQSYGFTIVENPLSDFFKFITPGAFPAVSVTSSGVATVTTTNNVCATIFTGQLWPHNQYSEITLINGTAFALFQIYLNSNIAATNQYVLYCNLITAGLGNSATFQVLATVGGTQHVLDSFTATPSINDRWRAQIDNNVLTFYQNGTLVHTTVDNTYSAQVGTGFPGFGLYADTGHPTTGVNVSLWTAGGAAQTLVVDAGHTLTGTLQGNVQLKPSISLDAIQYVSDAGFDGNDGLSWGTAKNSVFAALQALPGGSTNPPTAGRGTVYLSGGVSHPKPLCGIWMMGPSDPNYTSPPVCWIRETNGGAIGINIVGVPNSQPGPNPHMPAINLNKPGGVGNNGGDPTIWLSATGAPINFSNLSGSGGNRAILIGQCSNGDRTGTCSSSNIVFTNVHGSGNLNASSGPAVDITGNSFWIWFRDCGFVGNATNATGGRFSNPAAAILVDGTGNSGMGLIYVKDLNLAAGGIKFIPGSGTNGIFVDNVIEEGDFTHDVPPAVWFTSWSPSMNAVLQNVAIADPGPTATPPIQVDNPNSPALFGGPIVINPGGQVLGPAVILNSTQNVLNSSITTATPLRLGQVGFNATSIIGQTDVARRNDALVAARFLNRASSNTATWVSSDPSNSTITTGLTDPFGGTGAAKIVHNVAGTATFDLGANYNYTSVVGDWLVVGVWEMGLGGDGNLSTAVPGSGALTYSAIYQDNGNEFSDRWGFRWKAFKISNTPGAQNIQTAIQYGNGITPTVYGPVLYVIPNGTLSDNEVVDFATSMATTDIACPVGSICNVAGHPVAIQTSLSINGGTALTSVSGNSGRIAQSSGTLTNNDFAKFDANGNIVDSGFSSIGVLSQITAATASNSINNGDNAQTWNWALTTAGKTAFRFTENTAATGGNQFLLQAGTIIGSTAIPLNVYNNLNGSQTLPALSVTPTWNTTGVVDAALLVNPTNTTSGAGSLLADFQLSSTSQWKVDKAGNTTQLGTSSVGSTPPACTPGTAGGSCLNEGTPPTAGSNYDTLYGDSGQHALTVNNNNTGSMALSRVTCVNVTGVTVSSSTTTDQNLMSCTLAANLLNVVGRTLKIWTASVYTTPAASVATLTQKLKLCTVSGCGSGTVITLAAYTSSANAGAVTNNQINTTTYSTTQTSGASSAYEAHGNMVIDLGASPTVADSTFADINASTVGSIDSTGQLFLQVTGTFSAASGSNSWTQRQMIVEVLN